MSKAHPPELKKFMDKKLSLKLNGRLRGSDPFMNFVIDECVEMANSRQQNSIGTVDAVNYPVIMLTYSKKKKKEKEQWKRTSILIKNKTSWPYLKH
uniref:Sm domain-containing protein n=1 Tax=Peromyscus maniculatus bairdii TaxID=230844 RepID=A0A8C8W4A1_PERMB